MSLIETEIDQILLQSHFLLKKNTHSELEECPRTLAFDDPSKHVKKF